MTTIDFPLSDTLAGEILRKRDRELRQREDTARIRRDHELRSMSQFVTRLTGKSAQLSLPSVRIESFSFSAVPGCPSLIQAKRHCNSCDEPTLLCTLQSSASREAILQRLAAHEADRPWTCCECRPTTRAVPPSGGA